MKSVRVWSSETKSFGSISDIEVQEGRIKVISQAKQSQGESIRYLLPGFCDASVSLANNARGGESNRETIAVQLTSHLSSGFSHILSVGDPNLKRLQEEIQKGRMFGPYLIQSQRPLLLGSHIPNEKKETKLYREFSEREESKWSQWIEPDRANFFPIFLKRHREDSFPKRDLYRIRVWAERKGLVPIVYSFVDPLAWQDALDSGYPVVFHAMTRETDLPELQTRNYLWAPLFALSRAQSWKENPKAIRQTLQSFSELQTQSHQKLVEPFLLGLSSDDTSSESEADPFMGLGVPFQGFPEERLLFASGTGNYALFPGTAALWEADIWLRWKEERRREDELDPPEESSHFFDRIFFWSSPKRIRKTHRDPNSRQEERIQLLETLSKRTCRFLKADHGGEIKVGGPAHFSVHTENPLKSRMGIFKIESMVLAGKLVYTPKTKSSKK
ncbi:hypothetical protein [Leptospira ryugenii]|uniref:hypothetical protein n=1 Tax=Leptospira ryugenii TaxID=1917863 RepID=UPI000D597859|nr:hypothetical protein [Leptospira ryugenii]